MIQRTKRHSLSARPQVTGGETRAELLRRNKRAAVPLRKDFVQLPQDRSPRHGMLAQFASNGDLRGLRAYLIVVAASGGVDSEKTWTTKLDSLVWARLFDAHLYTDQATARTAAWRTLLRLQDRRLIACSRERGSWNISATLLREDGTGADYTRPGVADKDPYLQLPTAFWLKHYDEQVTMPALVMLLAICKERGWAAFPSEWMPKWYGWSADTTERGVKKLVELGLVERRAKYKAAPLTPVGSTMVYEYRPARFMRVSARKRVTGEARTA